MSRLVKYSNGLLVKTGSLQRDANDIGEPDPGCCCGEEGCCVNIERFTDPEGVVYPPAFTGEVLTGPFTVNDAVCPPGVELCCSRSGKPYCYMVIETIDGECPAGWEPTSPSGTTPSGYCYRYSPSDEQGDCGGVITPPESATVVGGGSLLNIERGVWLSPCPECGPEGFWLPPGGPVVEWEWNGTSWDQLPSGPDSSVCDGLPGGGLASPSFMGAYVGETATTGCLCGS